MTSLLVLQVENLNWAINTQDWLSLKPTNFPPKKKTCTHQQVSIMEGGKEEMETNVTM
jgi:hypothetical protein